MTYSYDASEATTLDVIRGRTGDTDSTDVLLANETITAILTAMSGDEGAATVECLRRIVAKLARKATQTSKIKMSSSIAAKLDFYKELLAEAKESNGLYSGPYVGGVLQSDVDLDLDNTDVIQPGFAVGMWDND